jgi:outer membrane protein
MKKILLLVLSIGLLLGFSVARADNLKVGVLDVQKVMQKSPRVSAMQAKLKKQFAPQEKKITAAQKQLKADFDKYNKDQAVMKDADKKALQKKILAEQSKLRNLQTQFQQQLIAAQRKSMQSILKDIEDAVEKVAKDQKLDLVLTKASVAYNNPDLDVTDQVIKKLK